MSSAAGLRSGSGRDTVADPAPINGHTHDAADLAAPDHQRARWWSGRRAQATPTMGRIVVLLGVGFLVVAPILQLLMRAGQDGGAGYRTASELEGIGETLRTTGALALGSLVISMSLGTALAWLAHRLPRRLQWMSAIPILPIVMPATASTLGWIFLLSPRAGYVNQWLRALPWWSDLETGPLDIYSVQWIVIVTGLLLTSFVYVFVRSGLRGYNFELSEAAYICGASNRRVFVGITLPLLRPALVYGASIALLLGLGQFTAPLLLGTRGDVQVLTTEMYRFISQTGDFAGASAIALPLVVAGVLFVFLQRRVLTSEGGRFVNQGGKGIQREAHSSPMAAVILGSFGFVFVALPLFALVAVAFSPTFDGEVKPSTWSLENFRQLLDNQTSRSAINTSMFASVVGVIASVLLGYVVAHVLYKRRGNRIVHTITDVVVNMPLGVPAVVFGAGFALTYTQGPFHLYGKPVVLILVYVTLMLPFATRMLLAARHSLGDSFEEASAISGAGELRSHLSIIFPLTRGAISGASALIFVLLTHEFAASVLVRSIDTQVMGTVLFNLLDVSTTQAAAMAIVMCIVTSIGVSVAVWAGGSSKTLDRL